MLLSVDFVSPVDDSAADAVLHCDGKKITQVVRNLLSNALKFTAKCDSVDKRVIVKVSILTGLTSSRLHHSRCGNLEVCVTDTGPGIAKVCTLTSCLFN